MTEPNHLMTEPNLGDFLRDVLHDDSIGLPTQNMQDPGMHAHGNFAPWNVLDFSQNLYADFPDLDLNFTSDWDAWLNPAPALTSPEATSEPITDITTPSLDDSIGMSSAAFRRSAWRFEPNHERAGEVPNDIAIGSDDEQEQQRLTSGTRCLSQKLNNKCRDRIIASLFATCDKSVYEKVILSLPPVAVLDALVNDFLSVTEKQIDQLIYLPTLNLPDCKPELLAAMIAGGATRSPIAAIQKFGYALHEITRQAVMQMFEKDNSNARDLQSLQAFAICLEIGYWSGDRRIMEIAESESLPLATMLRRAERFRRSGHRLDAPTLSDSAAVLDTKWRMWSTSESWKRLVYHVLIRSGQTSIAFQRPPLISYNEVTLELPAPRCLWQAESFLNWRDQYITMEDGPAIPLFLQCIWSVEQIGSVRNRIDLDLTMYVILLSHWTLVWEWRQMDSVLKAQGTTEPSWNAGLIASSKRRELRSLIAHFQTVVDEWSLPVPREIQMLSELVRMNLDVAFEDLQLLAGKDSEEEAKRVYTTLKQWYHSSDSRSAMWRAGQIIQAAQHVCDVRISRDCLHHLSDFHAVVVYHAALAFWGYGLLARSVDWDYRSARLSNAGFDSTVSNSTTAASNHPETFIINREAPLSSTERHHFIALVRGTPALEQHHQQKNETSAQTQGSGNPLPNIIPLTDPSRTMQFVGSVMQSCTLSEKKVARGRDVRPPAIVSNLIQLLADLGTAASAL